MELIFWGGILIAVYSYFVYPIVLICVSGLLHILRAKNSDLTSDMIHPQAVPFEPSVAVVISAYNEEKCISERISNLREQDYPRDKLHIFVGSDGSTDGTEDALNKSSCSQLTYIIYRINRGKASVLNDLIKVVTAELVVFTDANTHFDSDAVRNLARHFSNPEIGAVSGELRLTHPGDVVNNDVVYWSYEQSLKRHESRLNALLGANGAIYAIRRRLYSPLPANTIVDDFQISMQIVRQGYQLKYDPEARAQESSAPSLDAEIRRRVRIGVGNYQVFFRIPWALNPFLGWRFFTYVSHKVLRWFTPHFLLLSFLSNFWLLGKPLYRLAVLSQIVFYMSAGIGFFLHSKGKRIPSLLMSVVFFVAMNVALFCGFIKYCTTTAQGNWPRTER